MYNSKTIKYNSLFKLEYIVMVLAIENVDLVV